MTDSELKLARELNEARQTIAKLTIAQARDKARIAELTAQVAGFVAQQAQEQLKALCVEREASAVVTPPAPEADPAVQ